MPRRRSSVDDVVRAIDIDLVFEGIRRVARRGALDTRMQRKLLDLLTVVGWKSRRVDLASQRHAGKSAAPYQRNAHYRLWWRAPSPARRAVAPATTLAVIAGFAQ